MLETDCAHTAELIEKEGFYRWSEEHKQSLKIVADSITDFTYSLALYYSMMASQNQVCRKNNLMEKGANKLKNALKKAFSNEIDVESKGSSVIGKGAYNGNVYEGHGLGTLEGKEIKVSQKGIDIVKEHLSEQFSDPANDAMIARLEQALANGDTITGADASFYMHELAETTLMNEGLDYSTAHLQALQKYDVSQFSVYHPDVIQEFSSQFNKLWKSFWGIE